ncbi:MAG: glycoside hydrolase family 97 C-terminal domain-containing protein, partial [Deltaproteobacteria bacterium]|nr:glycoside hydrolase family 97 C-terminal domain-containing protein [Deltaproteobacteria bacterium]
MTMESVRGAEEYKYTATYPAGQPARNTIVAFTRNVIGSMDFTPVTFTDALYPHVTTNAHELALSVVFESGIQHFADRVSGYQTLPTAPRTFLQQVPAAWDDTRFVDGVPGQWVALARRKGTTWYVAGISGETQTRTAAINLAFLGTGQFNMTVVSDGTSDRTFGGQTAVVAATDTLTVAVRPRGGFVARLVPAPP